MILVDSTVIMYAAGSSHPNKAPSISFLERVAGGAVEAAIDAEVLQEVLHRYRALGRWSDGRKVYDSARRIFSLVLPVTVEVLDLARLLLDDHGGLMARDALHAAIVIDHGLEAICSYDRDFDEVAAITRREP